MESEMRVDWDAVIADLSRPGGWIKGEIGSPADPASGVCLFGALVRQAGNVGLATHLSRPLVEIIREQYEERSWHHSCSWEVPSFNDHEDTTLDDVILVCEKARANQ